MELIVLFLQMRLVLLDDSLDLAQYMRRQSIVLQVALGLARICTRPPTHEREYAEALVLRQSRNASDIGQREGRWASSAIASCAETKYRRPNL
jgi:hypothetical protein